MSSNKQILQDKMFRKIEAIKTKVSKEISQLGWYKSQERMKTRLKELGYTLTPTNRPGILKLEKVK